MVSLRGPAADGADTPSPVTVTAAHTLARLATTPAQRDKLPAEVRAVLQQLQETSDTTDATAALAAALPSHRVQVSIRGQRFEMAVDTALHYFLSFHLFFALPVDLAKSCEALSEEVRQAVLAALPSSRPVMVAALCASPAGPPPVEEALNQLFLHHYQHVVFPVLAALVASPHLPEPATPVEVRWDRARAHWQFVFPRRLPDDVTVAEKARLDRQQTKSIAAQQRRRDEDRQADSGATTATTPSPRPGANYGQIYVLEPNENPFLLLQPHFMGIIVVLARRATKVLTDQHRATSSAAETAGAADNLAFPARWAELDYDAQLSLVQLVRSLGVSLLLEKFAAPTADPASSEYRAEDTDTTAEEKPAKQQQQQGEDADADRHTVAETATDKEVVDGAWVRQGCAACGMSGHPTEECPFTKKEAS